MTTIIEFLNNSLVDVFDKLQYNKNYATFQYSDRPDLSDFQSNCAMPLCKELHKLPREIAENIKNELEKTNSFSKITVDGPGFINVCLNYDIIFNILNSQIFDEKCGYKNNREKKTVVIDFSSPNIAKEMHVGHLRSTVIGESLRRIFLFAGDKVIADNHLGDWGTPMGMVIEGVKLKFPNAKVFQDNFNEDKITDLNLTLSDFLDIYREASAKDKTDEEFAKKVRETTKMLQDGYKPYRTLWKYFINLSMKDANELYEILDTHFDLYNGESSVHELIQEMIPELENKGVITLSQGAKIIDLSEFNIPPVIVQKSNGAVMYSSTDLATILYRRKELNSDLILYVVDCRQSLYFKQIFEASKKAGYLDDKHTAEHIAFGTMNGKDGKPFKTRSGDIVKLRDLIQETIEAIEKKSSVKDKKTIQKVAVACLKFADLINYRETNYIFDMDQFTNFEGKTGAYILYSLVRIKSILNNYNNVEKAITEIKSKEEKDLIVELTKFSDVIEGTYLKRAPNILAEYVYNICKKFNSFYSNCNINNETDINYKNSKISLIFLVKKQIEICLDLLGIGTVERM